MEPIKDLDDLQDSIHWMYRAMIEGDRAETLRWIESVRFWSSEIVTSEKTAVAA